MCLLKILNKQNLSRFTNKLVGCLLVDKSTALSHILVRNGVNVLSVLCRAVDELSLFSGCFLRRDAGLLESEQPVSEHVSVRGASLH